MKITQKLLSVLIAAFFLFGTVPGVPLGIRIADAESSVPSASLVFSVHDVLSFGALVDCNLSLNNVSSGTIYFKYGQVNGADETPIAMLSCSNINGALSSCSGASTNYPLPAKWQPNTLYHGFLEAQYTNGTQSFTELSAAQTFTTLAAISGRVFNDVNYNGMMDAGEPDMAGLTVTLGENGLTTTTSGTGQYMFTNLPAVSGYRVSIQDIPGFVNTTPRPLAVNIIPGTGIVQNVNFGVAEAKPPAVTTGGVSGMSATSAILNGQVNAFGFSNTAVSFEYGTSTTYGTTVTAAESPVNGINDTPVSASISGLTPNTTYHYRAVGINYKGKTCGDDLTFTTPAFQAPAPSDEYSPSSNTYSAPATVTAQPASTSAVVTPPDATMIPAEHSATFTLDETTYFIDGEAHEMDTVPFAQGERVLIPQRYLGIALGIPDDATHMIWDDAAKTATFITADGKEAKCSVGSKILTFDGREIQMDVEPIVQDGHIFLPARFLTEALGGSVSWNDLAKTVTVKITR